jgi:hypothetical protein
MTGECPAQIPNTISTLTTLSRFSGSQLNSGSKYASALSLNSTTGNPSRCGMLVMVLPLSLVWFRTLTLPHSAELLKPLPICG